MTTPKNKSTQAPLRWQDAPDLVTPPQAARLLNQHPNTVNKAISAGRIPFAVPEGTRTRKILLTDLATYAGLDLAAVRGEQGSDLSGYAAGYAAGIERRKSKIMEQMKSENTIDENILPLVNVLNGLEGVTTFGSCGGHKDPTQCQEDEGCWYVLLEISKNETGWYMLEFLAWLINHDMRKTDRQVNLFLTSPPPFINEPGSMLAFGLEGFDEDPQYLADYISKAVEEYYVSPQEWKDRVCDELDDMLSGDEHAILKRNIESLINT